ncbi:hypothetical protein D3C87_1293000 [compost metagenome]
MNDVAGDVCGDVEALSDVAVFGLAAQVAVGIGLRAGQRHALADLDQRRCAFAGLHLLNAAVAAIGAVIDDAGLAWLGAVHRITLVTLEVVVAGVDGDQQALGCGIELRKKGFKFVDLALIGVDDELISVGADLSVLADEILRHRQQVGAGVVLEGHNFCGCHHRKTATEQQGGEQGA